MPSRFIDLRSDTVTLPTAEMREAMAAAEVGDDVFDEDPSINRLQERAAELLGTDDSLFVPSGTMSNQIAINVHTRPGDEVLCEEHSHVNIYEGGGPAALSGVTCRPIPGRRGILDASDFDGKINPDDVHKTRSRLVSIENTHNRGGGSIYPIGNIERINTWARRNRLLMHLDGARLMNAVIATGIPADRWARNFDSISMCFSKGLGAPVGSILAGTTDFIREARRVRKRFGGGMRQAGILAAACLHALDHHVQRLAEDHAHARILARAFEECGFGIRADDVDTNILWIDIDPEWSTAKIVQERFARRGILILALDAYVVRAVTHLGISREDVEAVVAAAHDVVHELK